MGGGRLVEVILSALVLVIAAGFLAFAYQHSGLTAPGGYHFLARFTSVGGLKPGADVQISGVKVGSVQSITLDPKNYEAVVSIQVPRSIEVPADTRAVIGSSLLTGGKYLSLEPGSAKEKLRPGGTLARTESPREIESLIGRFIFDPGS